MESVNLTILNSRLLKVRKFGRQRGGDVSPEMSSELI